MRTQRLMTTTPGVFNISASSNGGVTGFMVFDPSGANTSSYYIAEAISSVPVQFATPMNSGGSTSGWNSLKAVFDQYRLNKIVITITSASAPGSYGTLDDQVSVYGRHVYDPEFSYVGGSTPNSRTLLAMTKVKRHIFTLERPTVTYVVYPRVLMQANRVVAGSGYSDSWRIAKPAWFNMSDPACFYGFAFYIPDLAANCQVITDITYDIAFRQSM